MEMSVQITKSISQRKLGMQIFTSIPSTFIHLFRFLDSSHFWFKSHAIYRIVKLTNYKFHVLSGYYSYIHTLKFKLISSRTAISTDIYKIG